MTTMLSPAGWLEALHPDKASRACYIEIAAQTKQWLDDHMKDGETISTADLVEQLFPVDGVRGTDGINARARLFSLLGQARGLGDYFTPGEQIPNRYGQMIRRKMWHRQKANAVDELIAASKEIFEIFGCYEDDVVLMSRFQEAIAAVEKERALS